MTEENKLTMKEIVDGGNVHLTWRFDRNGESFGNMVTCYDTKPPLPEGVWKAAWQNFVSVCFPDESEVGSDPV